MLKYDNVEIQRYRYGRTNLGTEQNPHSSLALVVSEEILVSPPTHVFFRIKPVTVFSIFSLVYINKRGKFPVEMWNTFCAAFSSHCPKRIDISVSFPLYFCNNNNSLCTLSLTNKSPYSSVYSKHCFLLLF